MGSDDRQALLEARVAELERWWEQIEAIAERVSRAFPAVRPRYPGSGRRRGGREEVVLLQISDTQCGAKVSRDETGGLSEYGEATFLSRMERYKETVHVLVNEVIRSSVPVHNCVVVLGGDFIEGELIFRGQQMHIDQPWAAQVFTAVHELAGLIHYLSGMFDRVRVETVDGNHGQVYGSTLNLDFLAYLFMRQLLVKQRNVEWRISTGHMNAFEIGPEMFSHAENLHPRTYLAIHGDQIRMNTGTPYYGLDRAYGKYLQLLGRPIETMLVGHFHTAGVGPDQSWAINGSWPGGSGYSISTLRAASRPQQWMWTVHAEVGVTSLRPIYLTDRAALAAQREQLTPIAGPYHADPNHWTNAEQVAMAVEG